MLSEEGGHHEDSLLPPGVNEEMVSSYSIMILLLLLGVSIGFAYILEKANFKWVHETFLALVMGAFVGLIVRYVPGTEQIKSLLTFDADLFFFLLLPPIIFNSGYDLRKVCERDVDGKGG